MPATSRVLHHGAYLALTGLTAVVDLLPARLRFGHVRTATRLLLRTSVPVLAGSPRGPAPEAPSTTGGGAARCALVTGSLDVGGVEAVVGLLARRLPAEGLPTRVLALSGGRMAETLRAAGVPVTLCENDAALCRALVEDTGLEVVQVHNVGADTSDALLATGLPLVPVVHNIELYRTPAAWAATDRLAAAARVTIAVSDAVRRHHVDHLRAGAGGRVVVIPNGAPPVLLATAPGREEARETVSAFLGTSLADDLLVVSLARYSAQKNMTGLVDAALLACRQEPRLRFVVAGEPEDWLEYRRADALRRSEPAGDRVHLIGDSDAATLLAAADVFTLNSFFEGWPVSATEAAAMGIPLALADVGGARELLADETTQGVVAPNAAGTELSLASVSRARRARHQTTRAAFASALVEAARTGRPGTRSDRFSHETMVRTHAAELTAASRPLERP